MIKSVAKKIPEGETRPRRPKVKVKLEDLPDAVVDGKLVAKIGDRVYFQRLAQKSKIAIHEGVVRGFDEKKGIVEIWDETVEQFYGFSLHQALPVVKLA